MSVKKRRNKKPLRRYWVRALLCRHQPHDYEPFSDAGDYCVNCGWSREVNGD